MTRSAGVLMHISSLPGEYGIGTFGDEAKRFIDFLSEAGYSVWQVLPFSQPDEFFSPYKSFSAFAGNPYFIDPGKLEKEGLLTRDEAESAKQKTPYACEFERLAKERIPLLLKAASRVRDRAPVNAFLSEHPHLLGYARFMALKDANGGAAWYDWKTNEPDPELVFRYGYLQYAFFTEWAEIRRYANGKGVRIIGDIPFYVSPDSADVWADPAQFDLLKSGHPRTVAGVPPDYFCADGQFWGNPIYRWDTMKKDGFRWWRERIAAMFEMFDGVRIDHFRAIDEYWEIPASAKTAREGKWKKGPGKPFIDALREVAGERLLIAEDLGDIGPSVERLIAYSGFPGMRVLQFAFLGDKNSPHLPHNYEKNCVAYTGTHDNNTLLGFMWEQSDGNRRNILRYCGYDSADWDRGYDRVMQTLLASHADLVIFPIQDLLHYGSDCRMNVPGRALGNWAFRVTREQIASIDTKANRASLSLYSRC